MHRDGKCVSWNREPIHVENILVQIKKDSKKKIDQQQVCYPSNSMATKRLEKTDEIPEFSGSE